MSSRISVPHRAYRAYCYLLARTIGFVFPARLWYRVLYSICLVQGRLLRVVLALTPLRRDYRRQIIVTWLMQAMLPHLVAIGRPFPIPVRDKNLQAILETRTSPKGVTLCSVHLPFVRLVLTRLIELGLAPTAVIAHETALVNGRVPVWGRTETLPGLVADSNVLFKVRSLLRQGGLVATLIDINLGDALNSNVFRLIRSVGARVVFFTTELRRNGEIVVEFFAPPDPFCLSDESVLLNLRALQDRTDRIVQFPSGQRTIATVPFKKDVSRTQVAGLELDSSS